jgi:DNA-binding LacI/PurR family transcriptional regulator
MGIADGPGQRAATRHLLEQGCRRIAFLCGTVEEVDTFALRLAGC